ncbi:MAG: acetyl-CoA synthase, partial [Deltaproteobacteria bacterium]|nr:acetyl-CoA synthase [Deltaproteobacteria bacterium]
AEEEAIREQRAKEQEERLSRKSSEEVEEVPMTAAKVQKTELEKMLATLNWIHKRN